jgi:hypothetical protein
MKEYKVKFTATFEAIVKVAEGQSLSDAVQDIDIPENKQCRYDAGTFEPSLFAIDQSTASLVEIDPNKDDVSSSCGSLGDEV